MRAIVSPRADQICVLEFRVLYRFASVRLTLHHVTFRIEQRVTTHGYCTRR